MLTVEPAPKEWHPLRPGDVELVASEVVWRVVMTIRWATGRRGWWWSISRPFSVSRLATGGGRGRWVGGQPSDRRTLAAGGPAGRAGVVPAPSGGGGRDVRRARALCPRGRPDGYSADVALQIAHPVWFLRRRLQPLQVRLQRLPVTASSSRCMRPTGKPLYVSGQLTRLSSGLADVADRRYQSCVEVGFGPGTPAPSASVPEQLAATVDHATQTARASGMGVGGKANGAGGGAGNSVSDLPGTTLGLGFNTQNPNGHPVTVLAVTPVVSKAAPIRYTGAKILIPPSRANPGIGGRTATAVLS